MYKPLVYSRIQTFWFISILSLGGAFGAASEKGGAPPASGVDLKCNIVKAPEDPPRCRWLVELRNSSFVPVRRTTCLAGDTVRFRNLKPGLYMVCLSGDQHRSSCQSVDLVPASGPQPLEFTRELQVPPAPSAGIDRHSVSLQTLAVPARALAAFKRSLDDQLRGDLKSMLQHLGQAIEIYPDYADAWNNLGTHYHRLGDYQQSIRSFTKVSELNPNSHLGWANLGGSLLADKQFKPAIEASKKALAIRPDDVGVNSQLGLSYYYLRDYKEARKYFLRALDLDPAFLISPQLYLVPIALADNSVEEAMGYLRSYLAYHPNSAGSDQARQTLQLLSEGIASTTEPIRK